MAKKAKKKGHWFPTRSRFTDCYMVEHSVRDVGATDKAGNLIRFAFGGNLGSEDEAAKNAQALADQLNAEEV